MIVVDTLSVLVLRTLLHACNIVIYINDLFIILKQNMLLRLRAK